MSASGNVGGVSEGYQVVDSDHVSISSDEESVDGKISRFVNSDACMFGTIASGFCLIFSGIIVSVVSHFADPHGQGGKNGVSAGVLIAVAGGITIACACVKGGVCEDQDFHVMTP